MDAGGKGARQESEQGRSALIDRPPGLSRRIFAATAFAIERHRHQKRKWTGKPYAIHPLRVARMVAALDTDLDGELLICAALLHDVVEDTPTTHGEIEEKFGEKVAGIVAELSQDKSMPRRERKERMIRECPAMSAEARTIKLADRLDNLRDLAVLDDGVARAYIEESKRLLAALAGSSADLEHQVQAAIQDIEGRLEQEAECLPGGRVKAHRA